MLHHCSGERRSPTACYTTALSAHGGSFLAEALLGGRQAEKLWSSTALLSKGGRTKLPGGGLKPRTSELLGGGARSPNVSPNGWFDCATARMVYLI